MLVALHKLTSLVLLAALGLRSHTAVGDDGDYKSWSPETKRQRSPIYRPSFGELTIPYLPLRTTAEIDDTTHYLPLRTRSQFANSDPSLSSFKI